MKKSTLLPTKPVWGMLGGYKAFDRCGKSVYVQTATIFPACLPMRYKFFVPFLTDTERYT